MLVYYCFFVFCSIGEYISLDLFNIGEASPKLKRSSEMYGGGARVGFSERTDTILNWTELCV